MGDHHDVVARLAEVRRRIEAACSRAGRDPGGVTLVAVSKLQPVDAVRAAVAAGALDLGENRVQDLVARTSELVDLAVRWHAIGPIQRNKVGALARHAHAAHALDRVEVAEKLAGALPSGRAPLPVYIQVNIAGEDTKSGVAPAGAARLVDAVRTQPTLELVGLMTMAPNAAGSGTEANRRHFAALRELAARHELVGLSMGTTGDFEVAVEEGATVVRVGRQIFGDRPRP